MVLDKAVDWWLLLLLRLLMVLVVRQTSRGGSGVVLLQEGETPLTGLLLLGEGCEHWVG